MSKKKSNSQYRAQWKAIKPFVSFKIDGRKNFTPQEKRLITIYDNAISALTARPHYVAGPRNKTRLKTLQSLSQHSHSLKYLKVAFVPSDGDTEGKPKFKYSKDNKRVVISHKDFTRVPIPIDPFELIENESYIDDILDAYPEPQWFSIGAGEFQIPNTHSRDTIADEIRLLMERYSNEDANNYFGNWLHTLIGYIFPSPKFNDKFVKTMQRQAAEKKKQYRARRNAKARAKYHAKKKAK